MHRDLVEEQACLLSTGQHGHARGPCRRWWRSERAKSGSIVIASSRSSAPSRGRGWRRPLEPAADLAQLGPRLPGRRGGRRGRRTRTTMLGRAPGSSPVTKRAGGRRTGPAVAPEAARKPRPEPPDEYSGSHKRDDAAADDEGSQPVLRGAGTAPERGDRAGGVQPRCAASGTGCPSGPATWSPTGSDW